MNGDADLSPGWTTETLHELFLRLSSSIDVRTQARFESVESSFREYVGQVRLEVAAALDAREKVTAEVEKRYDNLFAAHEVAAERAIDGVRRDALTALAAVEHVNAERSTRYDDRFNAQEHAVEVALTGQVKAVEVALAAVNKEFHEHLLQAREESAKALAATERAREIQRAGQERALDLASHQMDVRLDKLNEFRGALSDAQATMIPRQEARLLIDSVTARIDQGEKTVTDLNTVVIALRSSLQGQGQAENQTVQAADRSRNLILGVIGAIVLTAGVLVALFVGLRSHNTTIQLPATVPAVTVPAVTVPSTVAGRG